MIDLISVLSQVHYKPQYGLCSQLISEEPPIYKVWWQYKRPDSRDHSVVEWAESGAVLIEVTEDTDEETIVRTIFGMTLRLEEHEAREFLTYKDRRPFDPHATLVPA